MQHVSLLKNDLLVNLKIFFVLKYLNVFGCTKGSHHILYNVIDIGAVWLARVLVLEQQGSHPIYEVEAGGLRDV